MMGILKRIVTNNLTEAKQQLVFWEKQKEHLKNELKDSDKRIEQIKENIAEFEEYLADEQR